VSEGPEFITVAEGARLLQVSVSALRLRIRRRELRAYRLRRSRLIRLKREDVLALLEPLEVIAVTPLRVAR